MPVSWWRSNRILPTWESIRISITFIPREISIWNKVWCLSCLEGLPTPEPIANIALPSVSAMFIDGTTLVNILKPKAHRTFDDYAATEFIPYLRRQLEGVERLYVVWDEYPSDSLKQQAREARGSGTRRRILGNTSIPKNWVSFLRNDENKTELFTFLAVKISHINCGNKEIYTICLERVLTVHPCNPESLPQLDPCNHEEADSRIFLHMACAVAHGHRNLAIMTVATDVVVIAVAYIHRLPIEELWITFGTGKHYHSIPAHVLASALGAEKSRGSLFWYAFSGCDTVSSFGGIGKKNSMGCMDGISWSKCSIFSSVDTSGRHKRCQHGSAGTLCWTFVLKITWCWECQPG